MLIPQPKPQLISKSHTPNQLFNTVTKGNPIRNIPILAPAFNVKRGQKRPQTGFAETLQPFTKIRLQKPQHATTTSSSTVVKLEPLDIPLSPSEIVTDNNQENNPMNSNVNNDFAGSNKKENERENREQEEEDEVEEEEEEEEEGDGDEDVQEEEEDEEEDEEEEMDGDEDDEEDEGDVDDGGGRGDESTEDPTEFIPTDFLDQEHDIIEELEIEGKDSKTKDHSQTVNPVSLKEDEDDTMNRVGSQRSIEENKEKFLDKFDPS